jgi:tetratricopeptide (TPR) repeat protein
VNIIRLVIISIFLVSFIKFGDTGAHGQGNVTNDTGALMEAGIILYNLGEYNQSISLYDKILDIDPNNANALINKGLSLNSLGRFNESIVNYDKVLAIDPNNGIALGNKELAIENLR